MKICNVGVAFPRSSLPLCSMSTLEEQIRKMYAEIADYHGAFGDPIDHGTYNPYELIDNSTLTAFEREGVAVGILHCLDSAIDNSTYESAVASEGPKLNLLVKQGQLDSAPLIKNAAEAFFKSESDFLAALKVVFEQIVEPKLAD
jgi:hypothetical protein